jgi:hypothetical protein
MPFTSDGVVATFSLRWVASSARTAIWSEKVAHVEGTALGMAILSSVEGAGEGVLFRARATLPDDWEETLLGREIVAFSSGFLHVMSEAEYEDFREAGTGLVRPTS